MTETWINFSDGEVMAADLPERKMIVAIKKRDDLAEICGQVARQIWQAYEFSGRDLTGAALGQIPEGLKARAIAIALWRFVSEGTPALEKIQTKPREMAYREATEFLGKIAEVSVGQATLPSVGKRRRRFRHRDEDGI